jgi:hypothetical protein
LGRHGGGNHEEQEDSGSAETTQTASLETRSARSHENRRHCRILGARQQQNAIDLVGAGANSGIQFRSQRVPNHHAGVLKPDDSNDYVIRCEGPRIRLTVNGLQTVDYTEPDEKIPRTGIIGLQIHSGGPSEAWFKDITIVELKP